MDASMNHTMSGGGGGGSGEHYTHMTFFWGSESEILFSGWPGTRKGMYSLALVAIFVLAALVEWLSHCRLTDPRSGPVAAGLVRTAMHAARIALAYLVMLAVMSFNGGALLAAVLGHSAGYLLFGAVPVPELETTPLSPADDGKGSDLPPMVCC